MTPAAVVISCAARFPFTPRSCALPGRSPKSPLPRPAPVAAIVPAPARRASSNRATAGFQRWISSRENAPSAVTASLPVSPRHFAERIREAPHGQFAHRSAMPAWPIVRSSAASAGSNAVKAPSAFVRRWAAFPFRNWMPTGATAAVPVWGLARPGLSGSSERQTGSLSPPPHRLQSAVDLQGGGLGLTVPPPVLLRQFFLVPFLASAFLTSPWKALSTSGGASTCGTWHCVQLWRAADPSSSLVPSRVTKWLSPSFGAFFF